MDGVASTLAMYGSFVAWKNPWTRQERTMYMFGFDPLPGYFDLGDIKDPVPYSEGRQYPVRRAFPQGIRGRGHCVPGGKTRGYGNGGSSGGGGRPVPCGHFFRHRRGGGSQRHEFLPPAARTHSGRGEFRPDQSETGLSTRIGSAPGW